MLRGEDEGHRMLTKEVGWQASQWITGQVSSMEAL